MARASSEDRRPLTEVVATDRERDNELELWPHWALGAACALSLLLLAGAFLLPPRGDEPDIYAPVIRESIRVWPRANTWEVQYGVSPIYIWLAGGVGRLLHLESYIAARLVSVTGWTTAMLACFSGRRLIRPVALLALLNPIVLVYATRAHPYTSALGVFWAGWILSSASRFVRMIVVSVAANLHNFMLPVIGLAALLIRRRSNSKVLAPAAVVLAGTAGVVASWMLYGGIFPKGFQSSPFYRSYGAFSGFTPGYLPLITGFAGLLVLFLGTGPIRGRAAVLYGGIGMALAISTVARHPPVGPLFNTAARGGSMTIFLLSAVVGGLTMGLAREQKYRWEAAAALAALSVQLATIPYLYERYVWFGLVPVAMLWSTLQPPARPRRLHAWYCAGALGAAALYLRFGSL